LFLRRFLGDRVITIARFRFNSHPHRTSVAASLDKALYDDYLCLVALNKQQIQW